MIDQEKYLQLLTVLMVSALLHYSNVLKPYLTYC